MSGNNPLDYMKQLGITQFTPSMDSSPAMQRAYNELDNVDLDYTRKLNNFNAAQDKLATYQPQQEPQVKPQTGKVTQSGIKGALQSASDKVKKGVQAVQDAFNQFNPKNFEGLQQQGDTVTDKSGNVVGKITTSKTGAKMVNFVKGANKMLGGVAIPFDVVFSGARVMDKWNASGANALTRAAEVNNAITPILGFKAGGLAGGLGTNAITGWSNKKLDDYYYKNDFRSAIKDPVLAAVTQEVYNNPTDMDLKELLRLEAEKQKQDKRVEREQALTDAAKASYEQALALQGNGGDGNDNVPPPTTPDMPTPDGEPNQPQTLPALPKTTLDYTNLNGLGDYSLPVGQSGAMTGAAADFDPIADKFTQDILESNNVANQEQIMQQLQDNMQRTREVQARDPRYQGDILTPDNPYQVDTDRLRNLQNFAAMANRVRQLQGKPVLNDFAGEEVSDAQRLYQQQLANQAGVPYEDYINATMEARANEITNLATERDNILKQQTAQATNMKDKIGYMQERYKLRKEYEKAIMESQIKGQYDLQKQLFANQGNLDVAQTNVAGDVAIQRMKEQDPSRLFGNYASFAEALAYTPEMYRGQILYNMPYSLKVAMGIQSLTPEQLAELFAGRPNQVMMPQNRPTFGAGFNRWLNPNKE